jgi:hypothetical protein
MPSPAPGAERLAGGVAEDPVTADSVRPRTSRAWRWAGVAVFLLVIVVLFDAYLHLSKTYPENSDEANILLMANDMLHGNVYLSGWNVSDVPFITTELPEITLLVWLFGLHLNTAHIAAALTYTLVVAVAMLLAKGKGNSLTSPQAIARMALVLAIMLAPQPGVGIFVLVFSVGHIGTALPVMLTWLILDRFGLKAPDGTPYTFRQRWWVPVIVAVMIGWALMADPLVIVVAVYPVLLVCLARLVTGLAIGRRNGGGLRGIGRVLADRWLELSLAAAAGIGYLVVWWGGTLLKNAGGYTQQPVPYQFDAGIGRWFMQARVVVHGLLQMFGAYFVPGQAMNFIKPGSYVIGPSLSGLDQAIAITHVIGVLAALWGACAIARRFFRRDADFISQLLLLGIVVNLAAYIPSTLADHSALNVREIAPVLPFAAVLAGRMLADRVLTFGPAATIRLPRMRRVGIDGAEGARRIKLRLVMIPLIALFGWYSFGLFQQADTPAVANPFAQLEAYLEAHNLTYGVGGYWNASVITVDTGGRVTIRAVSPACLQAYAWENKPTWYDPAQHSANFLLLSNVSGYFSQFGASGTSLNLVDNLYPPTYLGTGGYTVQPGDTGTQVTWNYVIREYDGNLLSLIGKQNLLYQTLNDKPANVNAPVGPTNPKVSC